MRAFVNAQAARDEVLPQCADALAFHRALPGYAPTPLRELPAVASERAMRCCRAWPR